MEKNLKMRAENMAVCMGLKAGSSSAQLRHRNVSMVDETTYASNAIARTRWQQLDSIHFAFWSELENADECCSSRITRDETAELLNEADMYQSTFLHSQKYMRACVPFYSVCVCVAADSSRVYTVNVHITSFFGELRHIER